MQNMNLPVVRTTGSTDLIRRFENLPVLSKEEEYALAMRLRAAFTVSSWPTRSQGPAARKPVAMTASGDSGWRTSPAIWSRRNWS